MAELIDRAAALDILKFKPIDEGGVVDDCIMQVLALAKSKVAKLPAVDAVEVVRCKDCKHVCDYGEFYLGCTVWDGPCKADEWCSRGERREM